MALMPISIGHAGLGGLATKPSGYFEQEKEDQQ